MRLPNYHDGSLVNLMSSIAHGLGGESAYAPLPALPPDEVAASKNVVLLVLDGLGYEYLLKNGQNTVLTDHLRGSMTSVFPSTTAAAITTFATGLAPQQHAITGWFMHLKELGAVAAILPFRSRYGGPVFSQAGVKPELIFHLKPLSTTLAVASYAVMPKVLVKSDYNQATAGSTRLVPYRNWRDLRQIITKIIHSDSQRKYIYAYWPEFDALSHRHGNASQPVANHFGQLARQLSLFFKMLEQTDTTFIITADHGFVDAGESHTIYLKDHPALLETLTLPLCGEGRVAYCYVRPAKAAQFEAYVSEQLADKCDLWRSEEAIARNYFGLFDPNPRLFDRVGDFILVMKENYVLKDSVLAEVRHKHIGHHGGVSEEEMMVPLIVVKK